MSDPDHPVDDLLDEVEDKAESEGQTSVGDVVQAIGHRGYGPFLILPPLFVLSPLGGIPGIPSFFALLTALFAGQIAFGRKHLWLPEVVRNRAVKSKRVIEGAEKLRPVAKSLDSWMQRRLAALTDDTGIRVAATCALALCLLVPPLELLPFVAIAPMAAITVFGLAILFRDGLVMIVGYAAALAGLGIAFGLI